MKKYPEYKQLNLTSISKEVLNRWEEENVFKQSLEIRKESRPYIFYEGPPSANGTPGIHHVMARAIKDIFCRYKTMKGFLVNRKAGWDTHGLPIEIAVEKTLGITKEDIGKKISVDEYNKACRKEVMKYKDMWDDLTRRIGYWVDLDHPYITFDNKYIESVWYLLSKLYEKGLLYKGYTIQPFSPAAGTGLSTHELNQPGCYRNVKDNTVVAQFKVISNALSEKLFSDIHGELFFLAWTTTPWTLPSNTALAVGKDIEYLKVKTFNPYTSLPITVILAKDLFGKYFPEKNAELKLADYEAGQKAIPFEVCGSHKGSELEGIRYEQLLPYAQPAEGDAFRVVTGDFVTTEDGTGIVHIAPSFGADDFKAGKQNGIGSLTLVDRQGRFTEEMGEFAGRYVKAEYAPDYDPGKEDNVDIDIIVKLKKENRAFKTEKYEHSYPHCWRTDKPILYYPLDSWFIRTTAYRDEMLSLNRTINWKPEATGTGRFGNWLENLVDWNLSRSRYWGTPLPIWVSEDKSEERCISSVAQLKAEIEKSVAAGFMKENPLAAYIPGDNSEENYNTFDLHRPYADDIVLVSPSGKPMHRETDLIDVWFDSGAMPFAQFHYPFENKETLDRYFPADFIAEGVDQTRGWFFTLHAIATMVFDSVSFKTVVSNGLVLDKSGNKMSKRLGNAVDPFDTIEKYGPDATRWYMITNAQPWDNLKFDLEGVAEVQRKFFGTLYNTYSFFALYANIDGFTYAEPEVELHERPEIDRWILSELNSLISAVDGYYDDYEPTKAGRAIADFVDEHLSNWYVRLSRRRFWKGEYSTDKISAYQTLYKCLETVAILSAPIAPFFSERLFTDLNGITGRNRATSVHLADFSTADQSQIDKGLEERMQLAQRISSMVLSLRKQHRIRVRQPLSRIMIPVSGAHQKEQIDAVKNLILSEVNIKDIEYISGSGILVKKIKPNFKALGPRYGKLMKQIAAALSAAGQDEINAYETHQALTLSIEGEQVSLIAGDAEVITEDIPGWVVATEGNLTVALDVTITDQLRDEGLARELVNRIQNIRKEKDFEVTDKIRLEIEKNNGLTTALSNNYSYICSETLADSLVHVVSIDKEKRIVVELADDLQAAISVERIS
ncbi:isoleucyl-tRNA synthetase [Lentimicrobium saccharophilum]|uniref:Isoleucine--tRNA ligase n=1 Tax=Lentimicrobium saccharophilum TaxID=1678841 RepID=A0A0S7BZ30_9BACT|nr:isoleucine--tRNA ligase [Lentimicrobium saccharophilum]GAP41880.1 isoleucyl-tRNA synthetase [Lentimicrobium saccharophilum]